MTLLQIIPGSEQLVTGATNVSPHGNEVYGYLILVLVVMNIGAWYAAIHLFKKWSDLSSKMHENALEQTKTFTELSGYMERHNDSVENQSAESRESTRRILGRISSTGRKLQNNEPIGTDD